MAKQINKSAEFLPFSCAYVYPKDYNATSNLSLASTPKTYDVGYTQAQHHTTTDLPDTFNAKAERMRSKTNGYSFRFGLLDFISPLTLVKIRFKFCPKPGLHTEICDHVTTLGLWIRNYTSTDYGWPLSMWIYRGWGYSQTIWKLDEHFMTFDLLEKTGLYKFAPPF